MLLQAIRHIPFPEDAHLLEPGCLFFRLRAARGDLSRCTVTLGERFESPGEPLGFKTFPLLRAGSDALFDYFEAEIDIFPRRIRYFFTLENPSRCIHFAAGEFLEKIDPRSGPFFTVPHAGARALHVPDWARRAVGYQIFPMSFASGRREIRDFGLEEVLRTRVWSRSRPGGTLGGIIANLDYIASLGADLIYLNPLFTANTYHKYNVTDYFSIDPCFGGDEALVDLVESCHGKGIRVILDGVFNHSGAGFFAFEDLVQKGQASSYRDWYFPHSFPVVPRDPANYETFAFNWKFPKLNTANPEVREYLLRVGTHWIEKANIDGWRLDVADETSMDFWRDFRKAVKRLKPDAFLLMENWQDAQPWLRGDQFDGAMNYGLHRTVHRFFAERAIDAGTFDKAVWTLLNRYHRHVQQVQWNLLDGSDLPRFLAGAGNDPRRLSLASVFLFTHVGIPAIYYGDELGIAGRPGCEDRTLMPWADVDSERDVRPFIRKLAGIRRQHMDAILGSYETLRAETATGFYAYRRKGRSECLTVLLNNSEELRQEWTGGFAGQGAQELLGQTRLNEDSITLPPMTAAIFEEKEFR